MRYTIPIIIMVSGCVAGGPPDHPLTATWQGANALELTRGWVSLRGRVRRLERGQAVSAPSQERSRWPDGAKGRRALQLFTEWPGSHAE